MTDLPYRRGPSAIHGEGVFATRPIARGETLPIADALGADFGGYNHSCRPNVSNTQTPWMALEDIAVDEELTVRYDYPPFAICRCPTCVSPASQVDTFLDAATERDETTFTSTGALVNAARQWCDEHDERRFGSRALAEAMRRRGVQRHSNGQRRGWKGVKLR